MVVDGFSFETATGTRETKTREEVGGTVGWESREGEVDGVMRCN